MSILAGTNYDPAVAVSKGTTAAQAMTAIDTTNLRLTFTAPANGTVLVRMGACVHGATTFPQLLMGVMSGATVVARVAPMGNNTDSLATTRLPLEAQFVISGLTPGNSYTWDAAWGVETGVAATGLKYGGPNDTTTDNAYGGFYFEVWEAGNCLGAVLYDPVAAVTKVLTSLLAMTAFNTSTARITFTAPASGKILWVVRACQEGSTTFGSPLLGVLDGSTVKGRQYPRSDRTGTGLATTHVMREASAVVTGLTPGNSYSYDAAYGCEVIAGAGGYKYGGPDNGTSDDAFGALQFEIWAA